MRVLTLIIIGKKINKVQLGHNTEITISKRYNSSMIPTVTPNPLRQLDIRSFASLRRYPLKNLSQIYFLFKNKADHKEKTLPLDVTFDILKAFLLETFPQHFAVMESTKSFLEYENIYFGFENKDPRFLNLFGFRRLPFPLLLKLASILNKRSLTIKDFSFYNKIDMFATLNDVITFMETTYPIHFTYFCPLAGLVKSSSGKYMLKNWSIYNSDSMTSTFWEQFNINHLSLPLVEVMKLYEKTQIQEIVEIQPKKIEESEKKT